MVIELYSLLCPTNQVDKRDDIEHIKSLNGTLREESSITNMIITVEDDQIPDYNYAYIEDFNRYYFIDNIISIRNNIWQLHMSVDVLCSYADNIPLITAFVDRSESRVNNRIIDKKIIVESGYDIELDTLDSHVFGLDDVVIDESITINQLNPYATPYVFMLTGYGLAIKED